MRGKILTGVLIGLLLAIAGAVWWLRQPLTQSWDYVRQTVRPVETARIAVVGDNHGDNPVYRRVLSEVADGDYDLLLNLGDHTEHGTDAEFAAVAALEKTLSIPVYHTIGGHDIKTDLTRQAFIRTFQEQPNQVIELDQARLVVLDNADRTVGFSTATLGWLEDQLATAPDAVYLLAFHRPFNLPLSSLTGDDETTTSRRSNERFLEIIAPYRVAQIFTAHLHTYLPYSLNGVPTVVSGGGGDPAQAVLGGEKNNNFHYLSVVLVDDQATITRHPVAAAD